MYLFLVVNLVFKKVVLGGGGGGEGVRFVDIFCKEVYYDEDR